MLLYIVYAIVLCGVFIDASAIEYKSMFTKLKKRETTSSSNTSTEQKINTFIKSLKPNGALPLADDFSLRGAEVGQDFVVISHESKTIESKELLREFPVNDGTHIIHPGAIVRVDRGLLDGSPDYIPLDRAPINISVNVARLEDNTFALASNDNYEAQLNKKLNQFYEKYENESETQLVLDFHFDLVQSKHDMVTKFGLEAEIFFSKLNINAEKVFKGESSVAIIKSKQYFFDVTALPPSRPSKLFEASQDLDGLEEAFSGQAVPAFIDRLRYGRLIYIKIESSDSSDKLSVGAEAAVQYLKAEVSASESTENYKQLKNLKVVTYIYGGSTAQSEIITTTDLDKIREAISKYSKLSAKNPASPMSFNAIYLANNKRVSMDRNTMAPVREVYQDREITFVLTPGNLGSYYIYQSSLKMRRNPNGTLSLIPENLTVGIVSPDTTKQMSSPGYRTAKYTISRFSRNVRLLIFENNNSTLVADMLLPDTKNVGRIIDFRRVQSCDSSKNCKTGTVLSTNHDLPIPTD